MAVDIEALTPQTYIHDRLEHHLQWFDFKAVRCRYGYVILRLIAAIAAASVPAILNFKGLESATASEAASIVSLMGVTAISIESIFHYGERYRDARMAWFYLNHELACFRSGSGAYGDLSPVDAFRLLVTRCESVLESEVSSTVSTMVANKADSGTDSATTRTQR